MKCRNFVIPKDSLSHPSLGTLSSLFFPCVVAGACECIWTPSGDRQGCQVSCFGKTLPSPLEVGSCWTRRVRAPLLPGCWRSKLRAPGLSIPPFFDPASHLSWPPTSTSTVSAICLHDRKRKLNGKRKLARATRLWKFDAIVTGRPKDIVLIFSYSQEPHLVNSASIELGLISQNLVPKKYFLFIRS